MTLQETPGEPPRHGKKRTRREPVFEILNEHTKCNLRMIDKHRLVVPIDQYQRDESEGRIASEIAMHLDFVAFQALGVIERADGVLIVVDGGTRLAGMRLRQDIKLVRCLVFSGLTEKQEADVFLRINLNRRRLQTEQQQHAEEFSGEARAVRTRELLNQLEAARVGFDSMRTIRTALKVNRPAIETVIAILLQIATDKHVTARVMKGLYRLETMLNKQEKTLNKKVTIKRMHERFGTFDAVVNAMVKPRQYGNMVDMARALARTLNIKLPAET